MVSSFEERLMKEIEFREGRIRASESESESMRESGMSGREYDSDFPDGTMPAGPPSAGFPDRGVAAGGPTSPPRRSRHPSAIAFSRKPSSSQRSPRTWNASSLFQAAFPIEGTVSLELARIPEGRSE